MVGKRTLHQQSTLADLKVEDLTLFTMIFGMVVFLSIYLWLLMHRFRSAGSNIRPTRLAWPLPLPNAEPKHPTQYETP